MWRMLGKFPGKILTSPSRAYKPCSRTSSFDILGRDGRERVSILISRVFTMGLHPLLNWLLCFKLWPLKVLEMREQGLGERKGIRSFIGLLSLIL